MAAPLTPAERLERQRTDHRLVGALDGAECPIFVTGHRTAADARAGHDPVAVGDRKPPAHYRVVYDFDTLRGPEQRHRPTVVHVSPLANGSYPASEPTAWVVGDVVPWTPHFAANVAICHGHHVWIPNRTQLVDYVVHIGKLLNFDEPPPTPGYHGYNAEAVAYWRDAMGLKPLDPGLRFPAIRAEDVIGKTFAPAAQGGSTAGRFAAAKAQAGPRFQAVARAPGRFAPARGRS